MSQIAHRSALARADLTSDAIAARFAGGLRYDHVEAAVRTLAVLHSLHAEYRRRHFRAGGLAVIERGGPAQRTTIDIERRAAHERLVHT